MDRTNFTRVFLEGYDAFQEEGMTGRLVYNPYGLGVQHDQWDDGYQAALDAVTQKPQPPNPVAP